MSDRQQRSIGLTPREKENLERAKQLYEQEIGDKTDWGGFLGSISILGLAALGIYKMAKSQRQNPTAKCIECGKKFSIAYTSDLPKIVYVTCPHCGAELVVDFR